MWYRLYVMGLLPDAQNCGLRMRREWRERFPRHRFQRKPLVSDPGMHQGTCVKHVPWCMSGSLTNGGGENVPGIPGACATRNFAYLVRGPLPYDLGYDKSGNDLIKSGNNHYPKKFWSSFMKSRRITRPSLSRHDIMALLVCKISLYDNGVYDKTCLYHHILYTKLYVILYIYIICCIYSQLTSLCLWWDFNIVVHEVCGFALSITKKIDIELWLCLNNIYPIHSKHGAT